MLFIHRTYLQDEGELHEYFFGALDADKSTVTTFTEVTPSGGKYFVFDSWFVDSFKENSEKKEFEIGSKKFIPDYYVFPTLDVRIDKNKA